MPYFTPRPQVLHAVQWTGDNLVELEAWAAEFAPWYLPLVDNEDGTLTMSEMSGGWTMATSDWMSNQGILTPDSLAQYQEVTGAAPFSFDITGS